MLVYISGPYSAITETGEWDKEGVQKNIEKADALARQLREVGHSVICPHMNTAHNDDIPGMEHEDWLHHDFPMIAVCDCIVMMEGWEFSKGAIREKFYAESLGTKQNPYPIYYQGDRLPGPHLTELRCPEQAIAFREVIGQMYRVHLAKNADYSPANILMTGTVGLVTRIWDKMARLFSLEGWDVKVHEPAVYVGPREAVNEPTEDAYMDLACYGIIGLLFKRGKWGR